MNFIGLFRVVLVLVGISLAAPAHAQAASIYTCKDEKGRTITSDRPIEACSRLPMRELRKDGAIKRNIAPPLTRAQRRARAQARILERAESMRRRQEAARDRALVNAYPTMDTLDETRSRQLSEVQVQINETYTRMVRLHKQLQAAQAAARAYPPGKAPGPVKQKIARIASAILSEDALVKARLYEQEQIRIRFNEDATRLKVLLERQAEADRLAEG